jgi:hypothetical protein
LEGDWTTKEGVQALMVVEEEGHEERGLIHWIVLAGKLVPPTHLWSKPEVEGTTSLVLAGWVIALEAQIILGINNTIRWERLLNSLAFLGRCYRDHETQRTNIGIHIL